MSYTHPIYLKEKIIDGQFYQFLLLHHFKIVNNNYFKTEREFLYANQENKYSMFGYFDETLMIDKKFVFLLEYPDGKCFYLFEQTQNPLKINDNEDSGYNDLKHDCEGINSFQGLAKSNNENTTFLDGSIAASDNLKFWHFPIGQKVGWMNQSRIPAYDTIDGIQLKEVNLWIQINNFSLLSRFKYRFSCVKNNRFSLPCVYIFVGLCFN